MRFLHVHYRMSKSVAQQDKDYCNTIRGKIAKYEKEGNEEKVKHWKGELKKKCTKPKPGTGANTIVKLEGMVGQPGGAEYNGSRKRGGSRRRTRRRRGTRRA